MPGRLFLTRSSDEISRDTFCDLQQTLDPRRNIQPGQEVIALTEDGFRVMRWGLIPSGRVNARGRPVMETIVNARSETVFDKSAFEGVQRAVVPADGWYEWTGQRRRKTAWEITRADGALMWFAAIWDVWNAPDGIEVSQVATITRAPTEDVSHIHDRMGVILAADQIDKWLSGDENTARQVFEPWPTGTFTVCEANDVDWAAP